LVRKRLEELVSSFNEPVRKELLRNLPLAVRFWIEAELQDLRQL
jgi:hypothetical protein